MDWPEALKQLEKAKGEVFDPWLVELFVEEIRANPPASDARDVMIVPGGSLPWRRIAEDDDDAFAESQSDLEVLLDDFPFEDQS